VWRASLRACATPAEPCFAQGWGVRSTPVRSDDRLALSPFLAAFFEHRFRPARRLCDFCSLCIVFHLLSHGGKAKILIRQNSARSIGPDEATLQKL